MEGMILEVGPDGALRVKADPAVRASGTPDATYMYSAGGLFAYCGMDPQLVNALVGPIGVETIFNWVGTDITTPIYDALVYIGTSGSAQGTVCGDCGKPNMRECAQSACFGRVCQQTPEYQLDAIGLRMNQGIPTMVMHSDITDPAGNVLLAKGARITDAYTMGVMAAAYNLRRIVGGLHWSGNPANNLGGYWEWPGLALIVNTGKVDAINGMPCGGLDSTLLNFNATVGTPNGPSILAYMAAVLRRIHYRMRTANYAAESATTYVVMAPETWDCVADAVACEYGLRCDTTVAGDAILGAPSRNDALAVADIRDRMKASMTIKIDGTTYPVKLDNQIPRTYGLLGNQTTFTSDIYFITTTIEGQTIFWGEYQDMQKTAGSVLADFRATYGASIAAVSDGGKFLIAPTTYGGICFDIRMFTKPRLVCRIPQFQGRVQNVRCIPLAGPYPEPTGGGGVYELDAGGESTKPYMGLYGNCWPGAGGTILRD